jgi:flavin-dependent dehydrogenase
MTPLPCIVVGGGPAGAACAIELARNGRRIIVLEKTRKAHHKVCGEFLSVEAQALIAYLGVDIWALGATKINSLSLVCGVDFPIVDLPFCGAGLSRFRLDQALLQAAVDSGAQALRGSAVIGLEAATDAVVVHLPERKFRAQRVAFATGKHDLRGYMRPKGSMLSFKLQMRLGAAAAAMLQNVVHLTTFPGGYVGACLVEGGVATICWVFEQKRFANIGPTWQSQVSYLSRQSDFLGDLLAGAQALWEKPVAIAAIPYGFLRRDAVSQFVYPIGDQLAVIPSYTGDGMSIALHSGIAAARAILNETPAGEFQQAMISGLRPQLKWARAGNLLFSSSTAQRLASIIAAAFPGAVPKVIEFVANATRLRGFEPTGWLQAIDSDHKSANPRPVAE